MVSKSASDATNDTGKDVHTEVSNKENGRTPNPEHTEGIMSAYRCDALQ